MHSDVFWSVGILCVAAASVGAAQDIVYEISFPNRVHHEATIVVTVPDLSPNGVAEFRMSRSSPGRYAIHEFGKNVYDVRAEDANGRALAITRPNPYQWNVSGHGGVVRLTYKLYADRADGTYSQVDATHAHLNMPATFMWVRETEDRPISISFGIPEGSGWEVASQLVATDDPRRFTAPNLQYFLDSPTELSAFVLREWTATSGGEERGIRLAVHHTGTDAEVDSYAEMVMRVVDESAAVFGELPDFDVGHYTFIADYLPWASGDGMEHRNSTILSSTAPLARAAGGLIGTVSHEFFHAWNVERIRPRLLEPFDFERANMSRELWFAEGFTSYYGPLILARAGIRPFEQYARSLGFGLSQVINASGRRFFSPVEMSMRAPFVDAATAIDPTNFGNTFVSYYTWGAVIGLGLDLTLRSQFDLALDDYMRLVWTRHGKPEVPYTVDDLEQLLGELTGDATFAEDFFTRFVRGRDVADYESLLAHAGIMLRRRNPTAAFLGSVAAEYETEGARLTSIPAVDSPLYNAGVDRGDVILAIAGRPLRSDRDWQAINEAHRPGDEVEIVFESRGERRETQLRMVEDPRIEVVTYEQAGRPVTERMQAFRASWLGSRAGH